MLTWEELYEKAHADHAAWRGRVVIARSLGVSDGMDVDMRDYIVGAPVRVYNFPLSACLDITEHADEGGLLDVFYPAEGEVPNEPKLHVWYIDGPTYYIDGRVLHPEWWNAQLSPERER